jgi:hypothetical protein
LKGRLGTVLTESEPLGVNVGAEDVKKAVLRWIIRYKIREPIAHFPGVKWPDSMRAECQHRDIVAVAAFGDLSLDLG